MALAYSISSALNAVMLFVFLNKRMNGIYLGELGTFLLKVFPASMIMGVVVYVIDLVLPSASGSKLFQIFCLALEITAGGAVYACVSVFMGIEEAVSMYRRIILKIKTILNSDKKMEKI
jgi:putative peptidoglycan lipid II flippase